MHTHLPLTWIPLYSTICRDYVECMETRFESLKKSVITMRGVTANNGRHIDINTKLAMASLLSQN